jgi:hypothetical protein
VNVPFASQRHALVLVHQLVRLVDSATQDTNLNANTIDTNSAVGSKAEADGIRLLLQCCRDSGVKKFYCPPT